MCGWYAEAAELPRVSSQTEEVYNVQAQARVSHGGVSDSGSFYSGDPHKGTVPSWAFRNFPARKMASVLGGLRPTLALQAPSKAKIRPLF